MAGNISMENASYLQATKENADNFRKDNLNQDSSTPTFEVDSIELATPELFSQELNDNSETNSNNGLKEEVMLFDNASAEENHVEESKEKEPEMFYETDLDDDFEIPAFLRRQKN